MNYARELEKKSLDLTFCQSELNAHDAEVPLYAAPDGGKTILIGVGCVLLGVLIGMAIH